MVDHLNVTLKNHSVYTFVHLFIQSSVIKTLIWLHIDGSFNFF